MAGGMRRIAGALLLLCGLLPLAGCGQMREDFLYNFVSKEKVDLAKQYVSALQDGKIGVVEDDLDPKYFDASIETTLTKIVSLFPKEKPRSVRLINANFVSSPGETDYSVTLEYEYSHLWVVANVVLETKPGSKDIYIAGIHVQALPQSIEDMTAFRLGGQPAFNYFHLAVTIFIALFTLGTAIVAGFSYIPRLKWLWIIFILFGLGQFSLNWTTGQTGFNLLAFELFGAMYNQMFGAPPVITFGVPLGAILFWSRRQKWREMKTKDGAADLRS